ncbi:MAG TPA: hypothetical protein VGO59_09510 [Verrucomicrobiae bacterium]|jgi:hypothetical protein
MKSLKDYSVAELRQVISIKEQIEALQNLLAEFDGGLGNGLPETTTAPPRRKMSAAARRKIGLAQKTRWAKRKETEPTAAPAKRRMSTAGRARIAAAARARGRESGPAKPKAILSNRAKMRVGFVSNV